MSKYRTYVLYSLSPWHGLGTRVEESLSSLKALTAAGPNWNVVQKPIYTDDKILGVATTRYKIVQNKEAFAFTDCLLGEGVRYETAASLQDGKEVWILAKSPEKYKIVGDEVSPYMVFSNSHDGTGSIKVAMTSVRVICQNALNLALHDAKRICVTVHASNINTKLDEAMKTLLLAEHYMKKLDDGGKSLNLKRITYRKVMKFIEDLIPMPDNPIKLQENNIDLLRTDMKLRYFEALDFTDPPKTAWRFINAVSDFATHITPLRKTENYKENLFLKTIDGNTLIDKSYELVKSLV